MDGDPRAGKTFLRKQILKIQASSLMNVGLTSSQAESSFFSFFESNLRLSLKKTLQWSTSSEVRRKTRPILIITILKAPPLKIYFQWPWCTSLRRRRNGGITQPQSSRRTLQNKIQTVQWRLCGLFLRMQHYKV